MNIPNMDTKRIKRIEDGFTVETMASFNGQPTICDHCARQKCKIRNYVERTEAAQLKVTTCKIFIPALGFSILKGLNLPNWNTIRVGGAWADRLRPFQSVAIIDTKNKMIVRHCTVEETFVGTLGQLVEEHAINNHAIQAEIEEGKIEAKDAATRMMRILKNANGTNIAAADRKASVVYLVRD